MSEEILKEVEINIPEEKKTSEVWLKEMQEHLDIEILDPDGWDRGNFDFSFNYQPITFDEFNKRLSQSTIKVQLLKLLDYYEQH